MIVPVKAISNLGLTQQIYSEKTNGAHAHNRDRVPRRLGESFTREQKGGSSKMLTRLAGLPFLDGRVTHHDGPTFLHINSFFFLLSQLEFNSVKTR